LRSERRDVFDHLLAQLRQVERLAAKFEPAGVGARASTRSTQLPTAGAGR
jgi:hypothetical protein